MSYVDIAFAFALVFVVTGALEWWAHRCRRAWTGKPRKIRHAYLRPDASRECHGCRFWVHAMKGAGASAFYCPSEGSCQRRAPVTAAVSNRHPNDYQIYPLTRPDNGCGDWSPDRG